VRERLIELEIEKEEQSKALEILKQLRVKEKQETHLAIKGVREEASRTAD
jgi:hypothetical protein